MARDNVHPTVHTVNDGQVKFASGINVLLGLWLLISPWLLAYSAAAGLLWNSLIVGAIVAILAAIRFFNPDEYRWMSWVNLVLGLWIIASPWIFTASDLSTVLWNDLIVGILITVLAIWSLVAAS